MRFFAFHAFLLQFTISSRVPQRLQDAAAFELDDIKGSETMKSQQAKALYELINQVQTGGHFQRIYTLQKRFKDHHTLEVVSKDSKCQHENYDPAGKTGTLAEIGNLLKKVEKDNHEGRIQILEKFMAKFDEQELTDDEKTKFTKELTGPTFKELTGLSGNNAEETASEMLYRDLDRLNKWLACRYHNGRLESMESKAWQLTGDQCTHGQDVDCDTVSCGDEDCNSENCEDDPCTT